MRICESKVRIEWYQVLYWKLGKSFEMEAGGRTVTKKKTKKALTARQRKVNGGGLCPSLCWTERHCMIDQRV